LPYFLCAHDLADHQELGDCAFARFSDAKNEIASIPSFGVEREQSADTAAVQLRLTQPPLQLDQAAAGGTGHGFGAADDIHLGEDRFYVRFHGAFADE
jgi:hypothetical protein